MLFKFQTQQAKQYVTFTSHLLEAKKSCPPLSTFISTIHPMADKKEDVFDFPDIELEHKHLMLFSSAIVCTSHHLPI
jgi:hypothetical protein